MKIEIEISTEDLYLKLPNEDMVDLFRRDNFRPYLGFDRDDDLRVEVCSDSSDHEPIAEWKLESLIRDIELTYEETNERVVVLEMMRERLGTCIGIVDEMIAAATKDG